MKKLAPTGTGTGSKIYTHREIEIEFVCIHTMHTVDMPQVPNIIRHPHWYFGVDIYFFFRGFVWCAYKHSLCFAIFHRFADNDDANARTLGVYPVALMSLRLLFYDNIPCRQNKPDSFFFIIAIYYYIWMFYYSCPGNSGGKYGYK